ncbi:MAG: VWA domain-containing protein [Adhaeribacter sp.]
MGQFKILTAHSPWLILACLALGAGYSWILYSKKVPWSAQFNYLLAFLRFVVISFLSFLLLGPYIKAVTNTTEKPTIVFALDNSQSVGLFTPKQTLAAATRGLDQIAEALQEAGYQTEVKTLALSSPAPAKPGQVAFTYPASNLDELLSHLQAVYENRNLAGVVLLSDGIVNQGKSPAHSHFNFPLYPVALGDTIPKKDVYLSSLLYNKITYSGNKFPLVAEVGSEGFAQGQATVLLRENGRVLDRKTIRLRADRQPTRVEFILTAASPGKKHYEVVAQPQAGEYTRANNTKHAYLDIIKGKLSVLIAAAAPHPDIKALRAAIETNENFETVLYIPGVFPLRQDRYDVAVLHQIPSRLRAGGEVLNFIRQKKIPTLYVIGAQSDLAAFNSLKAGLAINRRGNQTDEVIPVANRNFKKFDLDQAAATEFNRYPPAEVPFADFALAANTEVVLYQQVGRVRTEKPLLATQVSTENRSAALMADGIWQWRLTEAAAAQRPDAFDKLMVSVVQLLTAQQNKKRLNVFPVQDEFYVSDDIRFEADVYNAIYEKIYNQHITLQLTNEKKKSRSFSFVNGEGFSGLNIGNLPGGVYQYTASAVINGKTEQDKGELVVQELQLEALNALADHDLLHQLGRKTGTRLYYPSQLQQLQEDLLQADFKNVIYPNETLEDLIKVKWLFFLILALVSAEWFLRKYYGNY